MKIGFLLMFMDLKKISALIYCIATFSSCQNWKEAESISELYFEAQSDTLDVTDITNKAKPVYRHSLVRFYQNNNFKLFSNGQNGDFFFIDSLGQLDFNYTAVPPDSVGNMVFRNNPVSDPYLHEGELLYLRMPFYLHKISKKNYHSDSASFQSIGGYLLHNIIALVGPNLFFYGHKNLPNLNKEAVVSKINLDTGESEVIFSFIGPTTVSKVTSDGKRIYVAHKYKSKLDRYDLTTGKMDSIVLEPSKLRNYNKIEFKKEYLSQSKKEQVRYREDVILDYKVIEGHHFQLIGLYREDHNPEEGFLKHLITVNKDGKLVEKLLPPNFLNFDDYGNIYSLFKENEKTYLVTTPIQELLDW
jgi:hypothetical protein